MRTKSIGIITAVVPMILAFHAAEALAQAPPPAAPAAPAAPVAAPEPGDDKDGFRFRGGVSLTAGTMLISDYSGFLAGVDGRLGVQINDLIGVYAVPHLSFGPITIGNDQFSVTSVIGVFSATALVDVTLIDQIFVGAGGGFGVVNNPSGPVLHFRAGGYPLMDYGKDGIRRKGLMAGLDMRANFLSLDSGLGESVGFTVLQVMGSVGYEAF